MKADTYVLEQEKIGTAMIRLAAPSVMVSVISLIYELINSFYIGQLNNTADYENWGSGWDWRGQLSGPAAGRKAGTCDL